MFYSHVNYSVTKIRKRDYIRALKFYSHVNYSVTKIVTTTLRLKRSFTVT